MHDRISCHAFHDTDGACCTPDEPCPLQARIIRLEPSAPADPYALLRPIWFAGLVATAALLAFGLARQERIEERKALANQEQISWFKLDRAVRP